MINPQTMRDLINLTEAVGLANRRPGEPFTNPAGDVITFQSLDFYPRAGRYTQPQMQQALDQLSQKGINFEQIPWVNQRTSQTGAFAIATFTTDQDQPYHVGRWFSTIKPNRTENTWLNTTLPGNFRLDTRAGQKETSDLKPSQILKNFKSNTPDSIAQQVAQRFGTDSDPYRAIVSFMGQDLPATVPAGNMDLAAFRDYFCELLGPIALVQGKSVEGNAREAADRFFGPDQGYSDCTISFNSNTIGGLYDSLLVNTQGRQIKLSSKGKEGASASITNLNRSLRELESIPEGRDIIKQHAEVVDIIQTIQHEGQYRSPLVLAEKFGIIDRKDIDSVLSLRDADPTLDPMTNLSDRLRQLYTQRKGRQNGRRIPFYHLLSSIAYRVADHVNNKTDFSEAACSILNHAALVQIYTNVTKQDSDFHIAMTAKYPSKAITGVLLDPGKVYFSSGIKGNFTFALLKNGATPNYINPADPVDTGEYDQDDREQLDQVISQPRLTGPGASAARSQREPKMTPAVLGREKRRR